MKYYSLYTMHKLQNLIFIFNFNVFEINIITGRYVIFNVWT